MRAKEFIVENTQMQEDPAYGLPSLDKHQYSVLDKLVKDARKRDRITNKAVQSLDEEIDDNKAAEVAKAVEWICKKLNIKDIPAIELSMDTDEAQGNHHTGGHVPGSGKIWVYAKNRNLVDLLRTVFHELVHVRQHELDMIKPNSSYPGSPIEAQADMIAGKYIKIYSAENPHIFE
jgi:Zn-dependent peptidase ImmA (M78 family)